MEKQILANITVFLPAGKATMAGPISAKFAFYKLNSSIFLKEYNERTKNQIGFTIPAKITIFDDKTFSFITKTPPTSELLLKHFNFEKGSKLGKKETIGELSYEDFEKIAKIKLTDLNTFDLKKAINCILGTALNMGIKLK